MKSYKTLIFVALLVVIGNNAFSQINGINYQAVAVDEQGKEIAGMDLRGNIIHNKAINVRFSILLGSSTGTILYQETHSTNTDPHGLFTLVIGQGVTTSQGAVNSIVDIDWSTQNHYLKVEIDFKQSGGYKLMGIQQLLAVPYSYYALKSGNPPQELTLTGNELSISNGNTITLPAGSYTAGEGIDITGNTITNTAPNQLQVLSISNDTIFLSNGGFVKLPPVGSNISYTDLLNKPTNLSQFNNDVGFIANESDPNFQASAAFGISLTNIANWNSSFSWGNHAGLYRPISYVPDWSEITGKPILFDGTWTNLSGKPVLATVSTSGSYNDLLNKPMLFSGSYSDLTNKPVLFDGTWNSLSGKPTTIAEYGITDAFNGDYNNLSNKPLLFSGSYTDLSNKPSLFSGNFSDLAGKPTTLLGYGITDAMNTSHSAYGITSSDITNWTVAYNWGNHATQGYLKSYTETDPIFSAWNKSNGISITASQVSDFETSVTNNAAVLANTSKNSYPTADATKLAGIETGAEVNVNADWNATSGDGQILNKPTLATVATSGNYNDLTNKPTNISHFTNDAGYLTSISVPSQTAGDILFYDGTNWARIPKGTVGQVMTINPTGNYVWVNQYNTPMASTTSATNIKSTGATLNGIVNANNLSTTVTFEYGTTTAYGNTIVATQSPVIGNSNNNVNAIITGLTLGTVYHYRVKSENALGVFYGSDNQFTTAYAIGESYFGGIIFYLDGTGQHGLVSALSDQSAGAVWGCYPLKIGGTSSAFGTGNQNTNAIVAGCATYGIAARICYNLVLNGFSDWFLPSKNELLLMYSNLKMAGLGNFSDNYYWSSSEETNLYALYVSFIDGSMSTYTKEGALRVRAVRAF